MSKVELYRVTIKRYIFVVVALLLSTKAFSQYTVSEVDPMMKWSQIKAANQKVVFPRNNPSIGAVVASYLDTISPFITRGLSSRLYKFPVLIHTTNILSNGMVT